MVGLEFLVPSESCIESVMGNGGVSTCMNDWLLLLVVVGRSISCNSCPFATALEQEVAVGLRGACGRLVVGEMISYPQSTVSGAGGLFGTSTGPNCNLSLSNSVNFILV